MKCKKCGVELQIGEKFCSNCGTSVSGEVSNNQKKNNNILVVGIVMLFFIAIIVGVGINTKKKLDIKKETSTIILKDITFNYDNTVWQTDLDVSDIRIKALERGKSKIQFTYYQDKDGNVESLKKSLIESRQNNNYTIVSSNDYNINNIMWHIVKYQKGNQICLELLYGYNFDVYVLSYTADSSVYNSEESMFKEIYNTLKYNVPNRYETEIDAQRKVLGEWDLGNKGFYVITPKIIYYYKDSTKSLDDFKSGTYIAKKDRCRGVENDRYTSEYVDCIRLTALYSERHSLGFSAPILESEVEHKFIMNNDGTYYISGDVNGSAIKVK